jgi:hypothetical protein
LNNKYNIFTCILVICLSFFGLLTGILTIISMIRWNNIYYNNIYK